MFTINAFTTALGDAITVFVVLQYHEFLKEKRASGEYRFKRASVLDRLFLLLALTINASLIATIISTVRSVASLNDTRSLSEFGSSLILATLVVINAFRLEVNSPKPPKGEP
jgi:hypothetical protein